MSGPTPRYTARLGLVLTSRMLEQLREAAGAQEMTVASWVRQVIRRALPPAGAKK